uniref:Gustatory receptor n=1 Tax=Anopheles epiroticus TaxID=199890 RepID=A0A182PZ66_9DIPT
MNLVLPLLPSGQQLLFVAFLMFKFFGFLPFPFDCYTLALKPSSTVKTLLHLPIPQTFSFLTLHWVILSNRGIIFYSVLAILNLNDIIKYGSLMMAIFVILLDIGLQRKSQQLVWEKLSQAEGTTRKTCVKRFVRRYVLKFYGYLAFSTCIDAQILYLASDSPPELTYWLVIFAIHTFLRLRHLFHMFFIDMLKVQLQQLHHGLVEIRDYIHELHAQPRNSVPHRKMFQRAVDRLLELKRSYGELWDLCDCINRTFGWSQICNFTCNFVQLSCDLYWLYVTVKVFKIAGWQEMMITLLPTSSIIVLLLSSAESCQRVASSLQSALLDIPLENDSTTLRKIIYRFGLQIAQQQMRLTAHGLFEINYSLLKMFGTGIITYMIIFITFSKEIKVQDSEEI